MSIKKKRVPQAASKYKIPVDVCLKCKFPFSKKKAHFLWHDVIECLNCGAIWVAIDFNEAKKWLQNAF